jgi:hypothetical protein
MECRSQLGKVKQQRRVFNAFFEVGVGGTFLEIEGQKEAHSTRIAPSSACFTRSW